MKTSVTLLLSLFFIVNISAQTKEYNELKNKDINLRASDPHFLSSQVELSADHSFELLSENSKDARKAHHRFQHLYKSIPVLNQQLVIHSSNGKIVSAFGNLSNIELDVNPSLTKTDVTQIALQAAYKKYGNKISLDDAKEIELVVYHKSRYFPELAYYVELKSSLYTIRHQYVIHAHSGKILNDENMICTIGIEGEGMTTFYGMQSFVVDSISPNRFEFRDPERNIYTYTEVNYIEEIIANNENTWNLPESHGGTAAIDVHYGTSATYDFFKDKLGYEGINNEGLHILSAVQTDGGDAFNNAAWDGKYLKYGSGDCNHYPTTTIEVVAHEYMHAVTEHTSQLVGGNESRGLNEGVSDVFGKAVEYEYHPETFTWTLGDKLPKNELGSAFRNMADPWEFQNPKYFEGMYYGSASHNIGSVLGHWYYLLIEGGIYTNEVGEEYDLQPMSRDDAIVIIFDALYNYVLPRSSYRDVANFTLLSASVFFGENSDQYNSIKEAWDAVGVKLTDDTTSFFDLGLDIKEPFFVCIGDTLSLDAQITNLGDSIILAGTILEFEVTNAEEEMQSVTLPEDLGKNQSYSFTIEKGPVIGSSFFDSFIVVDLMVQDDRSSNNEYNSNVSFRGVDIFDLKFRIEAPRVKQFVCPGEGLEFIVQIGNGSCMPIPSGEEFILSVLDDQTVLYSDTIQSQYTLVNDQFLQTNIFIDNLGLSDTLQFELEFASEQYVNSREIVIRETETTFGLEVFDFENENLHEDIFDYSSNSFIPAMYNGQEVVAVTGSQDTIEINCMEFEDFVTLEGSRRMSACVDLSDFIDPSIQFDLTQFRNIFTVDEDNHEWSNITRVSWSSDQDQGFEYIYGQEQGEMVFHDFSLPIGFQGIIELAFFHKTGNREQIYDNDFSTYDFTLIDNIEFVDESASTQDVISDSSIFPNPVRNTLFIKGKLEPVRYRIVNVHGQIVTDAALTKRNLEVSSLKAGVYFLELQDRDGIKSISNFVKI